MNQEDINFVKQMLWDYYRKLDERMDEVKYKVQLRVGGMPVGYTTINPGGIADEIRFCAREIEFWKTIQPVNQ